VHVAADGTLGVTYYDFRNNTPAAGVPTDYWLVHCHAGCTNRAIGRRRTSPDPSTWRRRRWRAGSFVGDYEGLANVGNAFLPFFVQTNSGNTANRTDAFATFRRPVNLTT